MRSRNTRAPWFIIFLAFIASSVSVRQSIAQSAIPIAQLTSETGQLDNTQLARMPLPPGIGGINSLSADSESLSKKQLLELAVKYYGQGKLDDAAVLYRTVLTFDSGNVDANYNLGVIYERQGRLNEAATYYEQALSLKPDDNEVKQALAAVESKLGANSGGHSRAPAYGQSYFDSSNAESSSRTSNSQANNSQMASDPQSPPFTNSDQYNSNSLPNFAGTKQKSSDGLVTGILKFGIGVTAKASVMSVKAITP